MYFVIEDDDLLTTYINVWDKVSPDIERILHRSCIVSGRVPKVAVFGKRGELKN